MVAILKDYSNSAQEYKLNIKRGGKYLIHLAVCLLQSLIFLLVQLGYDCSNLRFVIQYDLSFLDQIIVLIQEIGSFQSKFYSLVYTSVYKTSKT